jgi:hypothetical protein
MKFICLGCMDKEAWGRLSAAEQAALVMECTNFDQELAAQGHFAAGYALQDSATATTVRWAGGKASRVDGPFAETKEMLGGILILEARDKAEAVAIISRHPGIRIGPFEVRPANEDFMAQHPILRRQQEKTT